LFVVFSMQSLFACMLDACAVLCWFRYSCPACHRPAAGASVPPADITFVFFSFVSFASADNISRQNVTKLHAAIDLAEATGVEKPLVRKAKSALQALKRRKQHGGGITGTGNAAANPNPPIGHSQSRLQQQSGLASQAGGLSAAAAAGRACHLSGTSDMSGCPSGSSDLTSSSRSLSASSAALYSAAAAAAAATAAGLPGGWPEANSEESSLGQQHTEESEASCESGASTSHVAASPTHASKAAAAARTAAPPLAAGSAASGASGGGAAALFFTPPQAPHLAAVSSGGMCGNAWVPGRVEGPFP
jgi:hypothetical protein